MGPVVDTRQPANSGEEGDVAAAVRNGGRQDVPIHRLLSGPRVGQQGRLCQDTHVPSSSLLILLKSICLGT